jgi:hypothetical protein
LEFEFKALVVQLILDGRVEEALELLAERCSVSLPRIKVGLPKRHRRNALGCYMAENETICVLDSDTLKKPSIILHEFYHHMRTSHLDMKHKGTEKYATEFAKKFIEAHRLVVTKVARDNSGV